jgi:ABC-type lipoprotein export system ATPase subunit
MEGSAIDEPIVQLRHLTRIYGSPSARVTALHELSLSVRPGERIALLGKSGSGKSTLLNLLGGLDRPTSGVIEVLGQDLSRLSSCQLADYRLRTVGIIFQSFNLIASRTALQNVELPMLFSGVPPARRQQQATEALEAVGLAARIHHYPSQLSGGECQRVAIARAMMNDPVIVLADEPTGNLDSTTANSIMKVLLERLSEKRTLILVTHDEELARRSTDRICRLCDGRLVE